MIKHNNPNIKQDIDSYIDGKLSADETEELWSQIIQQDEYYDYLNTASNLKAIDAPEDSVPAHYLKQLVYAGAAVLFILIAVFGVISISNNYAETNFQPIATIELPFQRSAATTAALTKHDKIVREAVLLYHNGNFEQAVSMLNAERATAENISWESRLNIILGILYYNQDMLEKAKNSFRAVVWAKEEIDPLKLEEAYWYLGNTWYRLNDLEKAEKAMREVLEINGAYSRLAQKSLNEIENS